jgi:hypothetical protein
MAKELGPPDLAMGKYLSRRKVFQVLVVRDNIDRKGGSFKVVTPLREGIKDHQEFLVVCAIVEF